MKNFRGCMTALVTPFGPRLEVDYKGLRQNVNFQIANGISGLVPLGTTGEASTISDEERTRIIEAVVEEVNGRVPVIVGTGTNSTDKTIKYTKEAKKLGADAALIVSPYYNKPSQEGVFRHFEAITKAVDIPIIVYNIMGRTGINIETSTMARIASLDNITGVKEASGNLNQVTDVVAQLPEDFAVLSGDDSLTLPILSLGGRGVIAVVSNLLPKMTSDMVNFALSGDFNSAGRHHYKLLPMFRASFMEPSPVPIKTAMRLSGMPAGGVRLPLYEMNQNNESKLKEALSKYSELKTARPGRR